MRWHLTTCGVMLAGQALLAPGSMRACHEAIRDGESLVQHWRVTQLTGLGIPGPLPRAEAGRVGWHQIARLARRGCAPALAGPGRWRCAAAVLRWPRRGPAGPVRQVLPSRARVRVPVSRRGCRVTARCAGGQSHRWCEARSPRQQAAWPHGYRGLRHQPDRTARQITMNFVSTRSTTGDVARLADFGEKPPERTKERK